MAKLEVPKKIRTEDFKSDMSEVIEKIGFVYNNFADQVYQAFNGNIDYSNLKRQIVFLDVSTDSTGKLVGQPSIKISVNGKIQGTNVLNAINTLNSNIYPMSHPFINWTLNGQYLVVLNITGLQANSQYRLTVELIA